MSDTAIEEEREMGTWVSQADGVARCDNIEGVLDFAGVTGVQKSDVQKLIITNFAMDYLYKRNLSTDSNNRDICANGTFTSMLGDYIGLKKLVIENIIDEYEGDNRKTEGNTTKAAYDGSFYALFQNAPRDLIVTIKNINLSKTNLKNVKGSFLSRNRTVTKIMPSGLVSVNISEGKSWTEDNVASFNFAGSSNTLRSFSVSNLNTANVTSFAGMFNGCTSLTNFSVNSLNVPRATSFARMFNGCTELTNFAVDDLNASSVSSFERMFNGCTELTNCTINNFRTPSATSLERICNGCIELTNFAINNWITPESENTKNLDHMFYGCPKLTNYTVPNLKDLL